MNFSKCYYILALIISFNTFGMQVSTQAVEQEKAQMIIDISDEGLKISNGELICFVKKHWIDPQIRNMSNEQLEAFIQHNNYIAIKKMSNGEWIARAFVRGNGGGVIGAQVGFWGAKGAVHAIGHGSIWLIAGGVGMINPFAGAATGYFLEGTLGWAIEGASNIAGISAGIALATATGPV